MDEKLIAALVGGGASIAIAIVGQIFNPLAAKRLERQKSDLQRQLEQQRAEFQAHLELQQSHSQRRLEALKAELTERNSAQAARRDYEYDARKRLYAEVEPLFFTLYEASEEFYYRVRSLVRTAREGRLGTQAGSWIGHEGYYLNSTAFKLVLPSVIYRLVQRRLTFVDLSLDEVIRIRYLIVKNLVHSFSDHFDFAALKPSLAYEPTRDSNTLSLENRSVKRHQGIITGDFENILDEMITGDSTGFRACSFGEFEKLTKTLPAGSHIRVLLDLYLGFSPNTDPVLARMLLAQAGLAHLFMSTFKGAVSVAELRHRLDQFCSSEEGQVHFAWGSGSNAATSIETVKQYISSCLDWIETAP